MAITIECSGCKKRISVDEAFAGGMCRCPYCKEIVEVPSAGGGSQVARPDRPVRRAPAPAVRTTPQEPPPGVKAPPASRPVDGSGHREIPTAKPVRNTGLMIGLLALLAGLTVAALVGVFYIQSRADRQEGDSPEDGVVDSQGDVDLPGPPVRQANPFIIAAGASAVAGDIDIQPPVAYVLDAGGSMRWVFGYAVELAAVSVGSLPADAEFGLLVSRDPAEGGAVDMTEGLTGAGAGSAEKVRSKLEELPPSGATSETLPKAIRRAMALQPATIVLVAGKSVEDDALAGDLKSAGVRLVALTIDAYLEVEENHAALVKATGGVQRSFSDSKLERLYDDARDSAP